MASESPVANTRRPLNELLDGRISHVTLCIDDVERARAFYVGVLGLTELPRPALPSPGLWIKAAHQEIHLLVPRHAADLPKPRELTETPIAPHMALHTDHFDELLAELRARGLTIFESEYVRGQAFTLDPAGNILELNSPM